MFFEDEASYDKYPEFKTYIEEMVFGERGFAMRTQSLQNIKTWRMENATRDAKTFFAGMINLVIHPRSFREEIEREASSFADDDGLDKRKDCLFQKNILPLRTTASYAASQGVTPPKPDVVYGLKVPQFPNLNAPILGHETKAEICVAPGIKYAFFSMDNKSAQHSIEAAENQAMRAGATMVNARRFLNRKAARGRVGSIIGQDQATDTDAPVANTDAANAADDAAIDDPFVTHPAAPINTAIPAKQVTKAPEEELGVDTHSFAFTCSWVPQMANLHVHWFELRPDGSKVFHMNLLRGYLMSDKSHLSDFRKDVHNILDYGVSSKRKETLRQLEQDIAKYETGSW